MADQNLLTYNSGVAFASQEYLAPVAVTAISPTIPIQTTYCFISGIQAWANNAAPPTPTQDQKSIKAVFNGIIAAKQVTTDEISPVVQRIDWTANTVYTYYRDDIDMFALNPSTGLLVNNFYVKNRYDQVFKCLWNNNGAQSVNEPYFQPGVYGTNNIFQGADNYKWKYMFTVDAGAKTKFMDSSWIPVPISINTINPMTTSAGAGSIDVVNVISGGSGYSSSIPTTITINGSGLGFVGTPLIANGVITDVVVNVPGSNYTYANATISTTSGNGAILISPTSPIGGHGFDPLSELGCYNVMYSVQFNSSENGVIPTDITYYQMGLIVNPIATSTAPNPANSTVYNTTTSLIVSPGFGSFVSGEVAYQGTSANTSTFSGTVVDFNVATNVLTLINIQGVPTINGSVYGNTSQTTRSLFSYTPPDFQIFTGRIIYVDNRSGITRSSDGIEKFNFVLSSKDFD